MQLQILKLEAVSHHYRLDRDPTTECTITYEKDQVL